MNRIRQKQFCPHCEEYLERSDLVKGYEYEKDQFVVMESGDLEQAEAGASRSIEVVAFVDESQINPMHLSKTYYLVPEAGSEKSYILLLEGMQETGRVGITRFVMRGKEYIGAVQAAKKGLMLHILFHASEFKQMSDVFELPEVDVRDKERDLAIQIIDNLTEDFSDEMLADEHRERLLEVIRQKIEGQRVVVAETKQPAKVVDLMEALKRSLELTAQKKPVAKASDEAASYEELQERKGA